MYAFTIRNMTKATIRKVISAFRKLPYVIAL